MNEKSFASLPELDVEVHRRREEDHEVLEGNDMKGRRFGFLDTTTDEYLFVPFGKLSSAQITARAGGEPDPELSLQFAERLESDQSDEELLLAAGEREAAKNWDKFPTPEQTAARKDALQRALLNYDIELRGSRVGDPFRAVWSRFCHGKHHGFISVTMDHLGITCLVTPDGEWTKALHLTRLAWAEGQTDVDITEWVREQMVVMWPLFKGIPQCECQEHQRQRNRQLAVETRSLLRAT
jgi:hypothetical protein